MFFSLIQRIMSLSLHMSPLVLGSQLLYPFGPRGVPLAVTIGTRVAALTIPRSKLLMLLLLLLPMAWHYQLSSCICLTVGGPIYGLLLLMVYLWCTCCRCISCKNFL
uniref:Uncharacterized protein n=1 Tax=Cacopsylla melanoneura TaxID=428564 RepID=A0A8D8QTS3_9HEMI